LGSNAGRGNTVTVSGDLGFECRQRQDRYSIRRPGVRMLTEARHFPRLTKHPDRPYGPLCLPFNMYRAFFPRDKMAGAHLRVPPLRMTVTTPPCISYKLSSHGKGHFRRCSGRHLNPGPRIRPRRTSPQATTTANGSIISPATALTQQLQI